MKELSIEQKAKRYDEAFKEASVAHKDEDRHLKATLERIFPELKESEDERIRRQTLKVLNYYKDKEKSEGKTPTEIDECIAWLEKQGYIRTDVFIEKTEKWIDNFLSGSTLIEYKITPIVRNAVIENFKNYIKG